MLTTLKRSCHLLSVNQRRKLSRIHQVKMEIPDTIQCLGQVSYQNALGPVFLSLVGKEKLTNVLQSPFERDVELVASAYTHA